MQLRLVIASSAVVACTASSPTATTEPDSDGDGLSDFAELHKYGTDPAVADADERYDHAYSIVTTLEIVKPIDLAAMNDDYQDARLVWETEHTAVVEVRSFPLGTAGQAIGENPSWRIDNAANPAVRDFLAPGITADWDADLRRELIAALRADGIDPDRLTDKQLVTEVSAWLFSRDKFRYSDEFITYDVVVDAGKLAVNPRLRGHFDDEKAKHALASDAEALALGADGKAMFEARVHGDCTASAILQTTVLRALGIPTRIVLTIPLVDGNDPAQLRAIRNGLHHDHVRNQIYRGQPRDSWASHTFNEVFVGGRWVRLNYATLGQPPLDPGIGLAIHVNTMRDWGESAVAQRWGEYAEVDYDRAGAPFRLSSVNAYRSLALSDQLGAKAHIANPAEPCTEPAIWDLGFDLDRSTATHRIVGVRTGSAAARAGLRDGQELAGVSVWQGDADREATFWIRDRDGERAIKYLPRREVRTP
jgi:hypothetical protein